MKGKLTNTAFVVVLILGFTLFVSGLARSNEAPSTSRSADASGTPVADPTAAGPGTTETTQPRDPRLEADPTPTRTPTPINVGNFVWDDIDDDGRQDAGEPGLANVTVQLWNGAKTQLIDSATTNSTGNYTLIAPTPGDYRLRVLLPGAGDAFTVKDAASGDDLLDSDINPTGTNLGFTDIYTFANNLISITTMDAGINRFTTPTPTRTPTPVSVGNFIWRDLNANGVQDAGEPGEPGVTVQIWNEAKTQLIDSGETNGSGNYTVQTPGPGNYRVRVLLPDAGTLFTSKDIGSDDQDDSDINPSGANVGFTDVYVFASNLISITTIDAGLVPAAPNVVGNRVWNDLDGDGIQEPGEAGIPGITVQLRNSGGTVVDTAVTSSTGSYSVSAAAAGSYRVALSAIPANFSVSPSNQGASDAVDSEAGVTGVSGLFSLPNAIAATTWDIGLVPDLYEPLVPARFLETRNQPTVDGQFSNVGKRSSNTSLAVTIGGRNGVPATAEAVVVNITATEVGADGFVTAFPCGSAVPTASNLNTVRLGTVAGAAIVKLGTGNQVCFFTSSAAHLIVDVAGYFPAPTPYVGLTPGRFMDSRNAPTIDGQATNLGVQPAGTSRELQITGRGGVPANAAAVVLNLTITSPAGAGFASVYPCGSPVPGTSTVNYVAGQTVPNMAIAAIGTSGRVCIFTFASAHVIVDVAGYVPGNAGLVSPAPARLVDTRNQPTVDGQFSNLGPIAANTSLAFGVTSRGGVPANATTVVLNVTATSPVTDGFLAVYPCGVAPPATSNVNYRAGQTIANAVVVKVGTGGQVCVFSSSSTHVIVDVTGSMTR